MNLRDWSAFLKHDSHEYRIKLGFFGRENVVYSSISQKIFHLLATEKIHDFLHVLTMSIAADNKRVFGLHDD